MYSYENPGGKAYLYQRTLKKGCPHLLKYINKEKNRKTINGDVRAGSYNVHATGTNM